MVIMKTINVLKKKNYTVVLIIAVLFLSSPGFSRERINKYFIGIELNGTLCGYSEVIVKDPPEEGINYRIIDQKTYISLEALGRDITQKQVFTYHLDPVNGNFIYHDRIRCFNRFSK